MCSAWEKPCIRHRPSSCFHPAANPGRSAANASSSPSLPPPPSHQDINNILNTGEVPNMFAKDELMAIMEQARHTTPGGACGFVVVGRGGGVMPEVCAPCHV